MDFGSKQISMERVELPHLHKHPLIPFTRFASSRCKLCSSFLDDYPSDVNHRNFVYGGYRCNELECERAVFHKECVNPLPEINHSYHPDHPLKLIIKDSRRFTCFCGKKFKVGYCCSICDFKMDLECARRTEPIVLPENSYGHEHPLYLFCEPDLRMGWKNCKVCRMSVNPTVSRYRCHQCEFDIHVDCVYLLREAYHTSHPQHPLKSLECQVPDYANKQCLLCATEFDQEKSQHNHHQYQIHHCDVCNFSICRGCMKNPPPVNVQCPTTHKHQLHLVPRLMDFTCNACGTHGDRSPYFCLQCNFMIHRECIDLPRVININRHDHRISYTLRLGHGEWKCKVCRKNVDGFYGAYTCSKCPSFVVHALCATSKNVWDMIEREGTPEEEEIAPFEVIDANTIKHFSHDHNLQINKDGLVLHENIVCEACVFQICLEPFYSCEQCHFILHEKCANLPRKKRHVCHSWPFTLLTNSCHNRTKCSLCSQLFTGFRYEGRHFTLDVRCSSMTDSFIHESHVHPLYYSIVNYKCCSECGEGGSHGSREMFSCDECEFRLDYKCAVLPQKVMRHRYDDHLLSLSYGESSAYGKYWCEACETKVNSKKWFYTCYDCGVVLHISCVVGDFSYVMPIGSALTLDSVTYWGQQVGKIVSNTSICRLLCSTCNSRCKLPSVLMISKARVVVYFCSSDCSQR